MNISPTDFASLLCSRLCHDLLSPVGALNNGLELLADETDPAMRQRCLDLMSESARTSANKLKFFRLAFGAAGGFGDQVDAREAQNGIAGLFAEKRITLGWMVEEPTLPKGAVKVMMNLAMIAGDALVRGGQLDVGAEVIDGHIELVVRAEGPRVILDEELRAALTDGNAAVTSRSAAAHLAHALVVENGGSLRVSEPDDTTLMFGAVFNPS